MIAPIALFVYNRPEHTRITVEALARNEMANESILYIFSDAAKSIKDAESVKVVRQYISQIIGFHQVIIVEQEKNLGLAQSIIGGVTRLIDQYGRVIVLEDDLETSPYFLKFMNEALDFYETTPEVMHISGCRYPVEPFEDKDTFFLHVPLCWGWATWQRSWVTFEKNISVMKRFDHSMIKRFDFDNTYSYWKQLELNRKGKINTWFVFWYANLFLRGGLSLFPARSLVHNIGMDESGTHSRTTNVFNTALSITPISITTIPLVESPVGYAKHREYFGNIQEQLLTRVFRKLCAIFSAEKGK
ncbi:MAG: glycosyltransferase [Methylotenera sp.]|nr:glycosyltransferase [Methylotenera sp.]